MKTFLCSALSALLIFFCACSKPGDDPQTPEELLKGTDSLVVEYNKYVDSFPLPQNAIIQVSVMPPGTSWVRTRVSTNRSGQNYLVIELDSNPDLTKRTAVLTITATGITIPTKTLTVIQNGYTGPYLNITKSQITLGGGFNSIDSFLIQSNTGWTITINPPSSDWINISLLSGQNNKQIVLTTTSDNNTSAVRTATITVTPQNGSGLQPVNIIITQPIISAGIAWNRTFGESNLDQFTSVTKATDGGIVTAGIAGYAVGSSYTTDAWLVKTDASGNKQWEKKYGGTNGDAANAVITAADGGYIMAGFATSNDGDLAGANPVNGDA
ncbi:MAG: BACON domain-containing protein, partial [Bacteroidota bacterium]